MNQRRAGLTGGAIPACFDTMMLSTCRIDTAAAVLSTSPGKRSASSRYSVAHTAANSRKLDSPVLGGKRIHNLGRNRLNRTIIGPSDIHANIDLALAVSLVKSAHSVLSIQPSVLSQGLGDHLHRLGPLSDSVLSQPRRLFTILGHSPSELELGSPSTRYQSSITQQDPDRVDPVVQRSLEVVQVVRSSASENDGRRSRPLASLLPEDRHTVTSNLDGLEDVDETSLLGHGSTQSCQGRGTDNLAQASEIKLGLNLDDRDIESVQVVESEITDSASSNDDLDSRVGDLLDVL